MSSTSIPRQTFLVEAGPTRFRVDSRRTSKGYKVVRVIHAAPVTSGFGNHSDLMGNENFDDDFFPGRSGETLDTRWIVSLLKKHPRPAPVITVLTDRITSVISEMPDSERGDWLSGAEMEAQTISGLSTSEAITASVRLPAGAGVFRCWTIQAAMRDVVALRSAVRDAGRGRLVSVGHPGGVRLESTTRQLESWSEFALFHAGGGDRIDLRGWNGPEAVAAALEDPEVAAVFSPARGGCVLLAAKGVATRDIDSAMRFDFEEPKVVKAWSAALAGACDPLTGRLPGMPCLSVPKAPVSSAALAGVATVLALVTLLLIGGHYLFTEFSRTRLKADLAQLKIPAEKLADANKRITELKRELTELDRKNDLKGDKSPDVDVFEHRHRIGALLEGIAAGAAVKEVVVLTIRPDGLETVITGAATSFNAPQTLAGRIDAALADSGWRASLVRRTAKLLFPDSGPWSYEIRLTPGRPVVSRDFFPGKSEPNGDRYRTIPITKGQSASQGR